MIDDKKIEEAAVGAADLYEQDLPMMSYYEDTEVDGQHHFCQEFGAELFKGGVKWAINEFLKNLWHPASKVPEIGRVIIMENHYPDGRIEFPSRMRKSTSHNPIDGETQKWFYIGDLFPKEGGGEQ